MTPSIFAYIIPFSPPKYETISKGIAVITREDIRWDRCDIKSISLLGNVLLRQEAQDENADEIILLRDHIVTEGSVCNVFIVQSGVIMTPSLSNYILPGITRNKVISLAKSQGKVVRETSITEDQLRSADEIWLTSSTKEIVPVALLDNVPVSKTGNYPVWREIFEAYQTAHG
jgi:D-alanine transaminase